MGIYPSDTHPQVTQRYFELDEAIGAEESSPEGLIVELQKLAGSLNLPLTFEEADIRESEYMAA